MRHLKRIDAKGTALIRPINWGRSFGTRFSNDLLQLVEGQELPLEDWADEREESDAEKDDCDHVHGAAQERLSNNPRSCKESWRDMEERYQEERHEYLQADAAVLSS